MNSESNEVKQPADEEPYPAGWLAGAIMSWLIASAPAFFVYSEWKVMNEFTVLITFIPALLAFGMGVLGLVFLVVWAERAARHRKMIQLRKTVLDNSDQRPPEERTTREQKE